MKNKKRKSIEEMIWRYEVGCVEETIAYLEQELRSYKETLHLYSTFENWKQLQESQSQLKQGKVIERKLEDL